MLEFEIIAAQKTPCCHHVVSIVQTISPLFLPHNPLLPFVHFQSFVYARLMYRLLQCSSAFPLSPKSPPQKSECLVYYQLGVLLLTSRSAFSNKTATPSNTGTKSLIGWRRTRSWRLALTVTTSSKMVTKGVDTNLKPRVNAQFDWIQMW